jgi:hypothetical protein
VCLDACIYTFVFVAVKCLANVQTLSTFVVNAHFQVYGGGVSIIFGSFVYSTSLFNGQSGCSAGATHVSDLVVAFDNCRFIGCIAAAFAVQGRRTRNQPSFAPNVCRV